MRVGQPWLARMSQPTPSPDSPRSSPARNSPLRVVVLVALLALGAVFLGFVATLIQQAITQSNDSKFFTSTLPINTVVSFALNGLPEQFHKQFNQPAANTVGKAPASRILLEPRPEAPKPLDSRSLYHAYEFINVVTPQRRRTVIIEPLTHSLRSPQYDATKDIELLEDRSSLILLPNALPPSVVYQRAILLDLGTRDFASGMHWFLHHYPMVFDEIHAFELRTDGIFTVPPAEVIRRDYGARARPFEQGKFYFHNALVSTVDRAPSKAAKLSDEELTAMYGNRGMHWRWLRQNPNVPAVDLARLILEEVQPDKDDLVVIKMDLEGSEYDLVEHLRAKGVLPLVDEIFIESHFDAPDMRAFGWGTFRSKRDDALKLLRQLRDEGVYAHAWP